MPNNQFCWMLQQLTHTHINHYLTADNHQETTPAAAFLFYVALKVARMTTLTVIVVLVAVKTITIATAAMTIVEIVYKRSVGSNAGCSHCSRQEALMLYSYMLLGMLLAGYNSWMLPLEKHRTPIKPRAQQMADPRTRLLQSPVTEEPAWGVETISETHAKPSPTSFNLGACCWLKIACCGATCVLYLCCNKLCCCCCKKDCCDDR